MVKTVVGDQTQLNLAENRLSQSGLTSQVGLVIGKLSSVVDRGFVYDLVPTPPNDAGEPACYLNEATSSKEDKKKGSKSKLQPIDSSTLIIDSDWVAEHARQVSRMLVGGIHVIGFYVWISDTAFKNSTITLCQTVKGVAEAAPVLETDWDQRLLIHIGYSPRRWTCRSCVLSSNITSSSIRPCDFKMGRVLNSLQGFRCMYNFKLSFPICHESSTLSMSTILRHGISVHAKELRGATALIDGNLVVNEEPLASEGLHEVELLLPYMKHAQSEACSQRDVLGLLVFAGSVCSFAYLNSKEPTSQAVADIKDDIIRSLESRLDLICDEADEVLTPKYNPGREASEEKLPEKPVSSLVLSLLRKTCHLEFPRRVFIPWLAGTFICDYVQPSETPEVLKDHCVELMSMEAPTDDSIILQPEEEAPALITESFWDVAVPGHPVPGSSSSSSYKNRKIKNVDSGKESPGSLNLYFSAAVFFLLLSILAGFFLVKKS